MPTFYALDVFCDSNVLHFTCKVECDMCGMVWCVLRLVIMYEHQSKANVHRE